MMSGTQKLFSEPLGRSLLVTLAFAVCLVFVVAACGESQPVAPGPGASAAADTEGVVPDPEASATPNTEMVAPSPTSASEAVLFDKIPEPEFYGAASPSVEKRINDSDVIVRVLPLSVTTHSLRFRAIEYLKGSGPAEITVHASTGERNTTWDEREAVLFLRLPESREDSGASDSDAEFVFTDAHYKNPEGYTIDTLDPAWLPAQGGVSGASGASNPAFITDSTSPTGGPSPTISLADLRSKIAWIEGGEDIEGYERCIGIVLNYKQFYRDWEAYHGRLWTRLQEERQLASGASQGTVIYASEPLRDPGYINLWLSGQDTNLFRSQNDDEDEDPSNGYRVTIQTARPLPSGVYRYSTQSQHYEEIPCDFTPDPGKDQLDWIITATALEDAVHEAFFDPVAIGTAVGGDTANGVLTPMSFSLTEGGSTANFRRIAWESGRATMEFEPSVSLAGHHADFISLDGSVSLRLDFDDGSELVDGAKRTLTWTVCKQPWENGDLLMLRINRSGENLTGVTNDSPCTPAPPAP